ncbi:MAG: peptidase M14, partial [Rhodobacteraceae bacterium]|nr:peptidase M14 [Paracoccaceae bacterium]
MTTIDISFDTYHDYDTMTGHLRALADAYPKLATLTSIAQSHQGRDVWFMQLTNPETGAPEDKPA